MAGVDAVDRGAGIRFRVQKVVKNTAIAPKTILARTVA
jgi:hypothetical protein